MADRLNVPLYALMEHSLQLSAGQIAKMAEDAQEWELLRTHILEDHVEMRTIEKISRFDQDAADVLDEERHQRFQVEAAVRQIVLKFARAGVRPAEMAWAIDYGIRCRSAIIRGQPVPKDMPPDED
jgi:hypothetical protein